MNCKEIITNILDIETCDRIELRTDETGKFVYYVFYKNKIVEWFRHRPFVLKEVIMKDYKDSTGITNFEALLKDRPLIEIIYDVSKNTKRNQ